MRLWSNIRPNRLWEVGALRGVAIVMMVTYHLMWDLWFFRLVANQTFLSLFWELFQRTTASLFLLLVGVSLTISYNRRRVDSAHSLLWAYAARALHFWLWRHHRAHHTDGGDRAR
ncbi:MAG: heparan-alpha-glucosaminide N-acetyltransferase domain-containing protein [Caldilineaceae bacterium]